MRMKVFTLSLSCALLLSACSPGTVVKGNIYRTGFKQGKVKELLARFNNATFAIFPFKGIVEGKTTGIATDGNAIADMLSIQMLYHGYKVLERDKMEKLLEEKAFKETDMAAPKAEIAPVAAPAVVLDSGATDSVAVLKAAPQPAPQPAPAAAPEKASFDKPAVEETSSSQMVQLGKMLGVDFVICGSVVQYEFQMGRSGKVALAVTITSRILDVETGDIIFAMSAGSSGNNLPEALDGITLSFTDALKEGKVYVWE
jgi:curli biogenesis system outer membrane secretion channel CsgG